jgi:hypothetical protein
VSSQSVKNNAVHESEIIVGKSCPDVDALVRYWDRLKKKKLKIVKAGNPKPAGSAPHERWTLLLRKAEQGASVADYITANGNPTTLQNTIKLGYIELV